MPDKILVFVPCYNCAPQIGRTLAQFSGRAGERFAEILVLDNGSRDGTAEAAVVAAGSIIGPRVTVARNRENYHLGGSHKAAFAYAAAGGYTHVVVLHGDDQGSVSDVLPLLDAGLHRSHDACLGARFARGARLVGYSRFRILGNLVFNVLFSLTCRRRVLDLGSGLNVYSRALFSDPAAVRWADDLRFSIYLLLDAMGRGRPIHWFPITWREDDQVSNVRMASQAMRTLGILASHAVSRHAFLAAEHREAPRASYDFDIVHAA